MQNLLAIIFGAIFGVANIIPGVSGGTMLVVFGCYDKVCGALTLNLKEIKKNIVFLIFFAIGAVAGILGFSFVITYLFAHFPAQTYMFFIGLIVGSVPLIVRNATVKEKFSAKCIIPFVLAAAAVIGLAVLEGGTTSAVTLISVEDSQTSQYVVTLHNSSGDALENWSVEIDEGTLLSAEGAEAVYEAGTLDKIKSIFGGGDDNAAPNTIKPLEGNEALAAGETLSFTVSGEDLVFADPEYSVAMNAGMFMKLFLVSILASVAMIIPGVSGSFIFVVFGVYAIIIGAIKSLEILVLIPVAIGVILGLIFGARLITFLMKRYRLIVFSAILGLVAGSIYAIVPAELGVNLHTLIGAICLVVGGAISLLIGRKTKVEE